MGVKIYYTTVTASREVKSQQAEVMRILESKNIQFELIDISVGGEVRNEMRTLSGNPSAAPPQIFNDDQYCGRKPPPLQVFLHLLPALTTDHNVICKHHCPKRLLSHFLTTGPSP
ncbi:hypothetical protein QTP86_007583 [Hemibagrus guttatus]|nr:hypothetical protein QTP86_007583 [Hemibagrus guttatus]